MMGPLGKSEDSFKLLLMRLVLGALIIALGLGFLDFGGSNSVGIDLHHGAQAQTLPLFTPNPVARDATTMVGVDPTAINTQKTVLPSGTPGLMPVAGTSGKAAGAESRSEDMGGIILIIGIVAALLAASLMGVLFWRARG